MGKNLLSYCAYGKRITGMLPNDDIIICSARCKFVPI